MVVLESSLYLAGFSSTFCCPHHANVLDGH